MFDEFEEIILPLKVFALPHLIFNNFLLESFFYGERSFVI